MQDEERPEIHTHHSSCRDCVFATYEGKTQVACQLGRLEKYREQGSTIQAADEELEFELINGRKCPAFRDKNSEWAKAVHPDNRASAVRKELTVRTDVLVPLESAEHVAALPKTLSSLRALLLTPSSVTVVNNQSDVKAGAVHALLREEAEGLNWQMTDIHERTAEGTRVDRNRAIDVAAPRLKGHFYTVLVPGSELPPTFTLDLDRAVVDEMSRLAVVLPNEEGVGLTVGLGFHRAPMVNGNATVVATVLNEDGEDTGEVKTVTGIVEKALFLAKSHESPHMVAQVGEVCPSLK